MELAPEHNDTTNKTILNTLDQPQEGSEQPTSEQNTSKKPIDSEQRTGHGVRAPSVFTLLDLARLEFSLDNQQPLNAQDATNEQFGELADSVATVTDVKAWYLEERRDFINGLYAFCQENTFPFPFTMVDEAKTPTAPLAQDGAKPWTS